MAGNGPAKEGRSGKPRRKARGGVLGRVFLILGAFLGLVLIFSLYTNQEQQMARIRASAATAGTQYTEALERNQSAHETLASVGSDPYIERIARDQLGMVKPGERIFKTVE